MKGQDCGIGFVLDKDGKKPYKSDRRTRYTRQVIKDTFLTMLQECSFEKVTVTALCRRADVTRATFYLHYRDVYAVLDEVIADALEVAEQQSPLTDEKRRDELARIARTGDEQALRERYELLPACHRAAHAPEYRALFEDESLAGYILERMYELEKKKIPGFMQQYGLSREEAEAVFTFEMYGAYAVNRHHHWKKDDTWFHLQMLLLRFVTAGETGLQKQKDRSD